MAEYVANVGAIMQRKKAVLQMADFWRAFVMLNLSIRLRLILERNLELLNSY